MKTVANFFAYLTYNGFMAPGAKYGKKGCNRGKSRRTVRVKGRT